MCINLLSSVLLLNIVSFVINWELFPEGCGLFIANVYFFNIAKKGYFEGIETS